MKPNHHILVCQNERAADHPKGCCMARGSKDLLAAFKTAILARGIREQVEFDGSTCLDCCSMGPALVIYPEGVWYGNVQPTDVEEILDAVQAGTVVERLRVPDEKIRRC